MWKLIDAIKGRDYMVFGLGNLSGALTLHNNDWATVWQTAVAFIVAGALMKLICTYHPFLRLRLWWLEKRHG